MNNQQYNVKIVIKKDNNNKKNKNKNENKQKIDVSASTGLTRNSNVFLVAF